MASLNKVAISGHLGRDSELRQTQGGVTVLSFSVAFSDRRKIQGEWTDHTNWIDCIVFGPYAEAIHPSLTKGIHVAVAGKLQYSSWEKNGENRSKIEIVCDQVDILANQKADGLYESDVDF